MGPQTRQDVLYILNTYCIVLGSYFDVDLASSQFQKYLHTPSLTKRSSLPALPSIHQTLSKTRS